MTAYKKKAIITGGAGDIGRAICRKFLQNGFQIVIVDILQKALDDFSQQLLNEKIPKTAFKTICTDLTIIEQAKNSLEGLSKEYNDVFVHCVGFSSVEIIDELNPIDWKKDISLNLDSAYYSTSLVLPSMQKKKKGSIVFIGSVNADCAYGSPAYSAAKSGLVNFSKAIAMEYGRFGIRSNVVSPGSVATQAWNKRLELNPKVFEALKKWYPLKRIATPTSVANAVYFLASEEADSISGVNLRVDCGLSAGNGLFAEALTQRKLT